MASVSPLFLDNERETEIDAFESAYSNVFLPLEAEWQVLKGLAMVMISIFKDFYQIPLQILTKHERTLQYKHAASAWVSIVISFALIYVGGYSFDSGLVFVRTQKLYNIWGLYTVITIIGQYIIRTNRYSHLIIRGAARSGKSLIIPTLIHSFTNILVFAYFSVLNGTYLAGFYTQKSAILSATLHIQCLIVKKFLPKVVVSNTLMVEITQRLTAIIAFLRFSISNDLQSGIAIIAFEYGFAFLRFFLAALTEDGKAFIKSLKRGSERMTEISKGAECSRDESLFVAVPHESYALVIIWLAIDGGKTYIVALIVAVVIFGVFAPAFFNPVKGGQIKGKIE